MSEKTRPVCSYCGSADILQDAYAHWDEENQKWELQNVFDKGTICQDCGGETSIEWQSIESRLPQTLQAEGGKANV